MSLSSQCEKVRSELKLYPLVSFDNTTCLVDMIWSLCILFTTNTTTILLIMPNFVSIEPCISPHKESLDDNVGALNPRTQIVMFLQLNGHSHETEKNVLRLTDEQIKITILTGLNQQAWHPSSKSPRSNPNSCPLISPIHKMQ